MKLMSVLDKGIGKMGHHDEMEERDERDSKRELIKHHLDDIKEALAKCHGALEFGDMDEFRDNIAILQSSALDAEELATGESPQI